MVNRTFVDLMKWGAAKGIDSMTYGSLGSGILSGAIRTLPDFAPNDLRLTFYDFFKEPKFSKIMELLKVMDQIAESHKKPVAQVAVNWSTQKDYVGTALVGVRNEQEARENCAASMIYFTVSTFSVFTAATPYLFSVACFKSVFT